MKKIVILFIFLLLVCTGLLIALSKVENKREIYPATLIVVHVHDDIAIGRTSTGYEYSFDGDDYEVGDYVTCIMDNNETPDTIEDDFVREHRYAGYTEMR